MVEFLKQFEWVLVSRREFLLNQKSLPETLTDIQSAARFYYLQRTTFGGKIIGQTFGTSATRPSGLNLRRIEEDLSLAHLRLSRTFLEQLGWAECIRKYDREATLFYCDPPYWGTEGYGNDFGLEEYDEMASLAHATKGRIIISVNDIPEMRTAFKGLSMKRLNTRYTVGGDARQKTAKELLIWNWYLG